MKSFHPSAPHGVSRRRFLQQAVAGGMGVMALSNTPDVLARVMAQGTAPADVQGAGVAKGLVRLNFNENPLGPSPMALKAIRDHLHETNRYGSDASPIFSKLNAMAGVNTDDLDMSKRADQRTFWEKRNRIHMSDGSGNLLKAAAMEYLMDGGEVIEAEPGYSEVSEYGDFLKKELGKNVKVTRVPLSSGMKHDLEAMRKAVTEETRLVVITNPNNPTGTIVPRADLEQFVDSMPDHVTVLIDEAYIDFVTEPGYQSMADIAIARPRVLVTRTLSKVYGLPGLRVGYAICMPETVKNFWVYTSFPSPVAIHGATAALDDKDHIFATQNAIQEGREYLYSELDKLGLTYTPSQSNFMVVQVGDAKQIADKLAKQKVFVRNADRNWGVKNHIRVSIGTREENEAFINTLRQVSV
jgi:histidinol-phosphate aminotransferase